MLGRPQEVRLRLCFPARRRRRRSSSTPAASSARPGTRPRRPWPRCSTSSGPLPAKTVVAAGCYVERDRTALEARFPGVDVWTGVRSFDRIADLVEGRRVPRPAGTFLYSDATPAPGHDPGRLGLCQDLRGLFAPLRLLRHPAHQGPVPSRGASRPSSARPGPWPVRAIKEIDLISHDTTWFGRDSGIQNGLARLLDRLRPRPRPRMAPLPLRLSRGDHRRASGRHGRARRSAATSISLSSTPTRGILKAMGRGLDGTRALRLIERLRTRLPGAAIGPRSSSASPARARRNSRR